MAISSGTVTVHDLSDPANQAGELDLQVASESYLVELTAYQSIDSHFALWQAVTSLT